MARPVEYDKQNVLLSAMRTFWEKGYEGTSVSDLLAATGLTSRSMYNIFGSKNGLFKEALETYYSRGVKDAFAELKDGQGTGAVRQYLRRMTTGEPVNGCLFVNTLSEKNLVEPDCLKMVTDYFAEVEGTFKEKLTWAKAQGDFEGNPGLRARQLVLMLQGTAQYIKTGVSLDEMKESIDDLLDLLKV